MIQKLNSGAGRFVVSILSLSVVVIAVRGELQGAVKYLAHARWQPIGAALAIYFVSLAVVSYRTQLILTLQGVALPIARLYYLWMVSSFFNLFLPSAVGGDIAKVYYIYKDCKRKTEAVTSVLIDRFMGLLATISLASTAFVFSRQEIRDLKIEIFLGCFVILMAAGALFMLSRRFSVPAKTLLLKIIPSRFERRIEKLFKALSIYHRNRPQFFAAYFLSILGQILFIALYYFLAKSLAVHLPFGMFVLLVPLVSVCSMIPSIGGLGVREASTVYFFQRYLPAGQAVALSLVAVAFLYGVGAACGVLYALRGGAPVRELEGMEEVVEEVSTS